MRLLFEWLFKRLPLRFSLPLVALLAGYLALAFPALIYRTLPRLAESASERFGLDFIPRWLADILWSLSTLALLLIGILAAYSIAALLYRWIRPRPMPKLTVGAPVPSEPPQPPISDALGSYHRIGIILAGGGAKGAYQAGALQAIHEFLEEQNAHQKVKMIAATSIGSWNAMFWLAGLIKDPPDGKGVLRQWWEQMDVKGVIRPAAFFPFRQNYLLSSDPWQEVFDRIFSSNEAVRERLEHHLQSPDASDSIHFYFTRSNVGRARLEFTTNNDGVGHIDPSMPGRRPREAVVANTWRKAVTIQELKQAVFASMDLPPLFPYTFDNHFYYEDGGVIDNLPVRFGTEIEHCDLLFILPLNASFTDEVTNTSISNRLFRVMDVRQGVMERNSFKLVYLYNELAALRSRAEAAEGRPRGDDGPDGEDELLARAAGRRHSKLHVMAICPGKPLILDTAEFWKTAEAARAFHTMYTAAKEELGQFATRQDERDWVGIAVVNPQGERTYLEDF